MKGKWPQTSLIVLNWNGRQLLETCLPLLLATDYPNFDVMVVDNGSSDDSVAYVRANFPQAKLIENEANLGFAGGMNVGMRQATGEILVLVNTDVRVCSGWLKALVAAMNTDPMIGVAGCKVYYPDRQTLQHAGGIINYPQALPDHWGHKEVDEGQYDVSREVDYVIGAVFALRRDLLEQIGYLDEGFYLYFEDPDYCFRARCAGYKVVYVPDAVVIHDESASSVFGSYNYLFHFHRSRLRFVLKHYTPQQIAADFALTETGWLKAISDTYLLCALQQAYLKALISYPALYHTLWKTTSNQNEFQTVIQALSALRGDVWTKTGNTQGEKSYA